MPLSLLLLALSARVTVDEHAIPTSIGIETVAAACQRGDDEGAAVVRSLLVQGDPKLAAQVDEARLLLMSVGNPLIVRALLDGDASTSVTTSTGATALHFAAAKGLLASATLLLDHSAEVDAATSSGMTPLMMASAAGNHELVQLLLARGASHQRTSAKGETALHLAAASAREDAARALLASGADVDAATAEGATPLYLAAQASSSRLIRLLAHGGAAVDAVASASTGGATPLFAAVRAGSLGAVEALLELGASPASTASGDGVTVLHVAAKNGQSELIALLAQHGAPLDARAFADGLTPLHVAVGRDDADAVRTLLRHGAPTESPSARSGTTALHMAVERGHAGCIMALLAARASLAAQTPDGSTALHLAAFQGDVQSSRLLLAHDGEAHRLRIRISGEQPLHVSAMYGTLDVARLLLEHGAQVDALTHTGQSALLLAASMGAADDDGGNSGSGGGGDGDGTKFVDMLLESGADARRAWRNGATALHEASARGRLGMVQRLLAAGARADAVDAYGDSPLHWAAASGAVNVTRALLEWLGLDGYRAELAHHSASASLSALAEPSAPPTSSAPADGPKPPRLRSRQLPFNQYGASPLHVAAFNGHVATLEVLLQTAAGQSAVGVADIFGETAVQVAPSAEARAVLLGRAEASMPPAAMPSVSMSPTSMPPVSMPPAAMPLIHHSASAESDAQSHPPSPLTTSTESAPSDRRTPSSMPSLPPEWVEAARRVLTPLEQRLLVHAAPPASIDPSALVRELAHVKRSLTFDRRIRSVMGRAAEDAVLQAPSALGADACAALRRAVDERASLRAGTTDGMPEHTLHLQIGELQSLVGSASVEALWQLAATMATKQRAVTRTAPLQPGMAPHPTGHVTDGADSGNRTAISGSRACGDLGADDAGGEGVAAIECAGGVEALEIFVRRFSATTRPWIKSMQPRRLIACAAA